MAVYSTNEFKSGLKVLLDGDPCSILENEYVKPGKGQAFNRVRLRNLLNNRVWERTFKSGESLEGADISETNMEYLYNDGDGFHFMNSETYDQVSLSADMIGDQAVYLQPEMKVDMAVHEGVPVSIDLPQRATLEVVETEPTVRGQTASSSYKPAVLSNGVRTMVPPHIATGMRIVVMTADGSYVERAKD